MARASAAVPALLAVVPSGWAAPVWLVVFLGGYGSGAAEASDRQDRVTATADNPWSASRYLRSEIALVLRISGWPSAAPGNKWRAPARILHVGPAGERDNDITPATGQGVMLTGSGPPPSAGDMITGMVELRVPPAATMPGGFDFRLFLAGRSLQWQGRVETWKGIAPETDPVSKICTGFLEPVRTSLVERIENLLPDEEANMAAAVLLGIRSPDSRRASRPFSDLGLAHLFAVSGLHVGILLGIFLLPGQAVGLTPWQKMIPLVILLPVYVLLTGMPGSVVRAASLGYLAVNAGALGRPLNSLRTVGLLFWAGTVWDPVQDLDTGLKLSYFAAGGILAVSSLTGGLRFSSNRMGGLVLTGLAVSAAAQWFTLPLVAGSFGRISVLSPVANLLAVPVFGLAVWCVVLALLCSFIWPFGAQAGGALAWLLFRSLSGLANFTSSKSGGVPIGLPPPGVGKILLWGALSMAGLLVLHRYREGSLSRGKTGLVILSVMGAGLVLYGPMFRVLDQPGKVTAWQFDVGQGDCGLLVFPDGWALMIDTAGRYGFKGSTRDGPLPRNVAPFLLRNGRTGLDAVVLTHGHLDHTGGALALASEFEVGQWLVSGRAGRSLSAVVDSSRILRPVAGHVLHRWKEWEVAVLYPPGILPEHLHENDHSLVVVLKRDGKDMAVWTGDLETEGEKLMIEAGLVPRDVQVWKAGHHGSNTSGSNIFLDLLAPELILVSCGIENGYGHPNHGPYVIGADTVTIGRTDLQGSLRLEWSETGDLAWKSTVSAPK